MTVESFASERDKEIATANRSGIRTDLSDSALPRQRVLPSKDFHTDDFS
jgi:hypothetical protein